MSAQEPLPEHFFCTALDLAAFDDVLQIEPLCYSNPWSREVFIYEFGSDVALRVALRYAGIIVGYSFNHVVVDELHVLNLAVHPDYRCQGGASLLLKDTIHQASLRGALRAFLEVRPSNAAGLRLYEKFGFKRLGVRKCYYRDNGEDAIIMQLDIEPPPY